MNAGLIFDIGAGIVLAFFIVRGLFNGFSGEIIGFVGLFVSIFCAMTFTDEATEILLKFLPSFDRTIAGFICSMAIFILVEIIFSLIGIILSFVVSVARLSLIDHVLGMFIGALKTLCLIIFIYAIFMTFNKILPTDWMNDSYCMKYAGMIWPEIRNFLEQNNLIDFRALTGRI